MSEGQIRYEAAEGIAVITIDRPSKRNASQTRCAGRGVELVGYAVGGDPAALMNEANGPAAHQPHSNEAQCDFHAVPHLLRPYSFLHSRSRVSLHP